MKIVRAGTALLVAVALLAGCSGGQAPQGGTVTQAAEGAEGAEGEGVRGGTLRIINGTDVDYLDTATAYSPVAWTLERAYTRLLYSWASTADGEAAATPVPDLAAEEAEVSDDGLTYTFTLREGVRWAPPVDRELVAGDFVYALHRLFDESTPSSGQPYALLVRGAQAFADGEADAIEGIRAVDDQTLEISLEQPAGDFLSIVAMGFFAPVPEEEASQYTVGSEYSQHVVALGPYMLEEYEPESAISFVRNPNWDAETDPLRRAWVDRIEVSLGAEEEAAQQVLEAGDADLSLNLSPPVARLQALSTDPELSQRFASVVNGCVSYLPLNTHPDGGAVSDVRVRQAINYALDRESLRRTRGGPLGGEIATTILPPNQFGHEPYDLYPSEGSQGDVERAQELLAEAGFADGLELSYVGSSSGTGPAFTTALQAALERVGITLSIKEFEGFSVYYDSLLFPDKRLEHQLGDAEWCPDYPGDGARSFFLPLFHSRSILPSGNNNMAEYSNPEVDEMIDAALAEQDAAARRAQWTELDERIMRDAPWAPWLYVKKSFFWSDRVQNWTYSPWILNPDLTSLWIEE